MLSGHAPSIWSRWRHPESMPASERTVCFRGDIAQATLLWAIRESMAPANPQKAGQ